MYGKLDFFYNVIIIILLQSSISLYYNCTDVLFRSYCSVYHDEVADTDHRLDVIAFYLCINTTSTVNTAYNVFTRIIFFFFCVSRSSLFISISAIRPFHTR